MKLFEVTNRYYLIAISIVFLIGGFISFYVMNLIIDSEFNQKLMAEKDQLIFELHTYENLRENYYLNIGDQIELTEVKRDTQILPTLNDKYMYDEFEKKKLPFRTLTFTDQFNGKTYVISITKSLLSNKDLIQGISETLLLIFAFLVISMVLINQFVSKKIWGPFFKLLNQLKEFDIANPHPIKKMDTNINEFNQLNTALQSMVTKSMSDYQNLKEYTENTSHEIQTPLAIIKNKSEILLNEPLNENQLNEVNKIYEAARRLSRLKEGLSTLSRIDNNQYINTEPINLKEFIIKKLGHFKELIEIKNLSIETEFLATPIVILNNDLAYMLITNLINNAIKHNVANGKIDILLKSNELVIQNTGNKLKVPVDRLFDRFQKSGNQADSTGLGLSLVKRIVNHYDMQIQYLYDDPIHKIILNF